MGNISIRGDSTARHAVRRVSRVNLSGAPLRMTLFWMTTCCYPPQPEARPIQHGNDLLLADSQLGPRIHQILRAHRIPVTKRGIAEPAQIKGLNQPQYLLRERLRIGSPIQFVSTLEQSLRCRPETRMLTQKKSRRQLRLAQPL